MSGMNNVRTGHSFVIPEDDLAHALEVWDAAIKSLHALPHIAALPVRVSVIKHVERTQL